MAASHVLNVDLAKIYTRDGDRFRYRRTVAWGDELSVREIAEDHVRIGILDHVEGVGWRHVDAFIRPARSRRLKGPDLVVERDASRVLKIDFVDVQQGDAAVIETPSGKVVLVDGGENQLFARYLAGRFRGTQETKPKEIDALVVTHGDADHFAGLTKVHETETRETDWRRVYIHPQKVFHNGLVKRSDVPEEESLGATVERDGVTFITDLHDDLREVPDEAMSASFRKWKGALETYADRGPLEMRRLGAGDDDAFSFLAGDEVGVSVLGPLVEDAGDGVRGLRFLGTPRDDEELRNQPVRPEHFVGKSASHTINGHSVILRLTYGNARFLFAGDLNAQAETELVDRHASGDVDLTSEVLKVPHHGSADFSSGFLGAVAPIVSVVSSGDENAAKDYVHPRATLMGALGRCSRTGVSEPLIFVTELVAFFDAVGRAIPEGGDESKAFFAFERTTFGLVKVRTDGDRLLVWTNSAKDELKEAYAFDLTTDPPRRVNLKRA